VASGRGGNGRPSPRRRETTYVRYPGCRHGHVTNPPRSMGYADSASTRPQTCSHPSPLLGGGWGVRSGSNVPQ
jgi:hypothetical protein